MLCGGPVVIIASTGLDLRYLSKKRVEGLTHNARASGIKQLPLIQMARFVIHEDFCFLLEANPAARLLLLKVRSLKKRYGSMALRRKTFKPEGMSLTSELSKIGASGFKAVYTIGSQWVWEIYLTILSHRCTPLPPAGGQ